MCGVAAIFSKEKNLDNQILKIINKISHRGPDDSGYNVFDNLALGSCRLSIFDISKSGRMPMTDATNRYVIVYNGEIYNFPELKKQFKITTKTGTDTEVLLELYARQGKECVKHLNGIFSFIIFDKIENNIFCCRDRLGVKPLYYYWDNKTFIASSEIKGMHEILKKSLNYNMIKTYLQTSFYDFGQETFYENIKQLEPSCFMILNLNDKSNKITKYWELNDEPEIKILENSAIVRVNDLINNSLKLQVRTDTKFGINVSSGLDSQLLISALNDINGGQGNIQANSYYFDEKKFNEKNDLLSFTKKINWNINYYKISPNDIIDNFDKTFVEQDGPFPGVPTIAKSLLIKRAYDKDCKVILEGQGGDDIAAGYRHVFPYHLKDLLDDKKIILLFKEFFQFKKVEELNIYQLIIFLKNSYFGFLNGGVSADGTSNQNTNIFKKGLFNNYKNFYWDVTNYIEKIDSSLKKILYRDIYYCKLQRILKSCDRASMSYGKELRVPLLDHNIVSFFYSIENNLKIKDGNMRYLYRKYLKKKFNSDKIFRKKMYISDPQTYWLKNQLFDWMYQKLSDSQNIYHELYDKKLLLEYLVKFKKDRKINNSNSIWQALCLSNLLKN